MFRGSRIRQLRDRFEEFREALPDLMPTFRARAKALPGKILAAMRRNWITLWLAPQAVIAFALFFHGAGKLQTATEIPGVAIVDGDRGERRERGDFAFKAASAGTIEHDWEGLASGAARVPFRVSNTHYLLEPVSVVLFRAPFLNSSKTDDLFRILKGRVTTDNNRELSHQRGDQTREIPKMSGDLLSDAIRAKIYPRIDSRLVVSKSGLANIAFSWSHPRTGYVAVLAVESDQVQYFPIENVDHVHASVQTDRTYAWQIVSTDRQILEGPFRFQIASGGADAWRKVLMDPLHKDKGGIDVLLDE